MNITEKLTEQYHYNKKEAETVAGDLKGLDSRLVPLYRRWLEENAEDDDRQFEGYSVHMLKQKFHMNYIAALLTLDWLVKEPEEAKKQISKGIK